MNLSELLYKVLGDEKYNLLLEFRYYNKILKKMKDKKKIIYMLVPVHGNLGDQAIAYASGKYLEDKFSDYEVIQVNCEDTYKYSKWVKKILNKDDLIFLHGGGNIGNHYIYEENARRYILDKFKDFKIISFTQTMFFSNNEEGRKELNISKKIYNYHTDLTIIAREKTSYKNMIKEFNKCKIILNPDIVLYLNDKINNKNKLKRNKIMTCLRSDKESYMSLEDKEKFLNRLKENYNNLYVFDTVIDKIVKQENREEILLDIWNKFFESKVVITDRLHGMIFCAITKTPCIVMRSLDHKVTDSYELIKELNYIRFVDMLEFENVDKIIKELTELEHLSTVNLDDNYFNKLREKVM